ncbi:MAG: glycosyltransferase family 4 protein [Anaerolineales bacterium]
MRWVDAVLLYTDEEVASYRTTVIPAEKLFATNNTVDEAPIQQAIAYWDDTRLGRFCAEHGLEDKLLLLYCGRLKPSARLDLALRALRQLHDADVPAVMAIIGDGPERAALASLAIELGIASSVRWLGAVWDQMDLAPWFLSAQAFVYPGPIGLSLLHALNYGLPAVTHNNRANHHPEISALDDGVNGLLFRESDADDLADKIAMILRDPQLHKRLSQGALETVNRRYSLAHMVEGFMAAVRYASNCAIERCRLAATRG